MTADALIHEVTSSATAVHIRRALAERRATGADERLDQICRYALLSPGKLLRPLLLVASAEAVGGRREQAMPAALAVEYLHVASLVHDDIIDGDDVRRGRAAVHAEFGLADAIVAGDAMILGLFSAVAECGRLGVPTDQVLGAVAALAEAGEDLCRGQAREALLVPPGPDEPGSGLDAYLEMAALKTGALFRGACRAGALLGGGTPRQVRIVTEFAEHAGLAHQMFDDLLPFLADPAVTGKPNTSDAANLRPTFPVLLAHADGDAGQRERIERVLAGGLPPERALAELRSVVLATGALDRARALARREAALAVADLAELPVPEAVALLGAVAELTVLRDR
jgi:geranylgeranyl pyrophosphate synthase